MPARARSDRSTGTREAILDAAERLCAEQGVHGVSNRTIAEAAGQGNTAVVGYHFGTKTDLVRAVVHRHAERIEHHRARMLERLDDRSGIRDRLDALVRPTAAHLAELGSPTWYARFGAQVTTDPALREIMTSEALASPALSRLLHGLNACLPRLPLQVRLERGDVARLLMVHQFAERERALADGLHTPRATWDDAATGLVDVLVAVWTAPVSTSGAPGPEGSA